MKTIFFDTASYGKRGSRELIAKGMSVRGIKTIPLKLIPLTIFS